MNGSNNKRNGFAGIILCIIAIIALKAAGKIIGRLLSVILTLAAAGVLIFCGIVVITALRGSSDQPQSAGTKRPAPEEAKLLSQGRTAAARLKTSGLKLKDAGIKEKCDNICGLADSILSALQKDPEKVSGCTDLLACYLPELSEIIAKYTAVQDGPETEVLTQKLSAQLDSISDTMTKKLSAVSSGQQLDISSDLEALKIALSLEDAQLPKDEAEELAEKYGE